MSDLKKFDVQIIDETDIITFEKAVQSRLNNGYTLGGTNAYFDKDGQQYFYALLYFKVPEGSWKDFN